PGFLMCHLIGNRASFLCTKAPMLRVPKTNFPHGISSGLPRTSSSALLALQHLLGGLRAEHPLVALPTFWVLFIQKFARRAKAPKLLIYFEPSAQQATHDRCGGSEDAPSIMSDEFDSLDATEKAAIRATLIRCRVLAANRPRPLTKSPSSR